MEKEPNPRELKRLKWQLKRKRVQERLGSATGFKGKTVWDLLQLLIVPALLAGLALWFNNQASIREQDRSILQRENEQKIAEDRAREEALQSYLDGFEVLLLQHDLRTSKLGDEVRSVARARTLIVLRGLDEGRKGALVQFLYESRLIDIDNTVINLEGSNLRGANLKEAFLWGADLEGADLTGANLRGADLRTAKLSRATLWGADLGGAFLENANLRGADLREAKVTPEQLGEARSLAGAIMPDGTIYKPPSSDDSQ